MSESTKYGAIFIGAYLLTSLLNYALSVALSWFFTPAEFGVLGVAQSILLLLALAVGSGFAWTANQDTASAGLNPRTRRRFRSALIANLALGGLLGAILILVYFTGVLPLGEAYRYVIPLVGLSILVLSTRAVVNGAARGLYRFNPVAVNMVLEVLVKIGVGLTLVAAGFSVAGVMAGFAAGAALALLHSLWIVRPARLWKGPGWFDPQVLSATAPLFLGMVGASLMLNLDVLGLKLLSPPAQGDLLAGYYQAAVILARAPVFIAQALTLVLFSYAAGKKLFNDHPRRVSGGREDKSDLEIKSQNVKTALKAWSRLLMPGGIALILAPRTAILLFFPRAYLQAGMALRIAAGGGLLLALVTLLIGVFQASGERRKPATAAGIATLGQVAVLVWLVPVLGINGAGLSLLSGSLIALAALLPLLAPILSEVSSGWASQPARLFRMAAPPLALIIPLLLIPASNRLQAFMKLLVSGAIYILVLLLVQGGKNRFPEDQEHRENVLGQFVRVLLGG
jgi:O-antigen/teichoic acid export membrane protein